MRLSRGLVRRAGRSVWGGLLILAVTMILRGVCYLPWLLPRPGAIPALEETLPVWSWSTLWLVAGGVCAACVAWRRFAPLAVGIATGLHALWGACYLLAWVTGDSQRGYVSALSYFAIVALTVWGFSRTPVDRRRDG